MRNTDEVAVQHSIDSKRGGCSTQHRLETERPILLSLKQMETKAI